MRTILSTLLLLLTCTTISSQEKVIDLSGEWMTNLGKCKLPGTTDENKLGDGKHPTDVTSQLTRTHPHRGVVSYQRDFTLPADMAGTNLLLELERTKPSTLWIDGDSIGSRGQLYAIHRYQLPSLKAGNHHIRIDINNRDEAVPSGIHGSHAWTDATQTNWNGILGKMQIVSLPQAYINWVHTYPDIDMNEVKVKMQVVTHKKGKYSIEAKCNPSCEDSDETTVADSFSQRWCGTLTAGENTIEFTIDMGENPMLWSEFHPNLYTLTATLHGKKAVHHRTTTFGMRKFTTEGTQFVINGNKTFLRGTHDACVFPLTAYCPTEENEWTRLFSIAKQYGINHYRFHSYTPTEAAFNAADKAGIYLHCELPMWGTIDSTTVALNQYLRNEAFTLLEQFGNHPSFIGLGLGNELWGDNMMMAQWLEDFRAIDNRHLYSQGSNNDLGWKGPKEGEDFYITCRVGGGEGFTTHTRTSFSFADADNGGILNSVRPSTADDFRHAVSLCPKPIVSHETCQFQIYPDYTELTKYTGVLHPYNLEIFRDRLKENGLTPQIDAFHSATGKWAVECYKADIEYCMRTPGFGGFQLLDIKDYPGQGSALCGILDAFMDSKGIVQADEFRSWNSPVTPLALMATHCWQQTDTLSIALAIANYTEDTHRQPLHWTLSNPDGTFSRQGTITYVDVPNGEVQTVGSITGSLSEIKANTRLTLTLSTGDSRNRYRLWVYAPDNSEDTQASSSYISTDTLDAATIKALTQGKNVLLSLRHTSIQKQSVGGLFTPDYWNYAMFKTISENNNKPVSPGTLGMLINPSHPLFSTFPTDTHTDWQWWSIALNSRPLILNTLPHEYRPLIQTVDNVERNHKLGILMEFNVGKGNLLITTTDHEAISQYPEGRAYTNALRRYISSHHFNPQTTISIEQLTTLLYSSATTRNIQGVRNITSYK